MITTLVRRVLPLTAIAILLAVIVNSQHRPPPGSDGYFHLRMGHELMHGWSLRSPGHLGPFDTADWLPTQWLAQIALAATEDHAGLAGVMWLAGALSLVLALAVYVCSRAGAAPLPAALATILAIGAASPGLSARPQVISYLLVVIITTAWLATLRDGKPRWWLIALAWVWAPLHGMWPFAVVIAVAAIAGLAIDRRFAVRRIAVLAAIPIASAIIVLATPLGLGIYGSVLAVGSRAEYFSEWGPTDFTEPFAVTLLAMFAIVLLVALKRRSLSWGQVMLVGLAGALAVSSERLTTLAAMILAPLVAEAIQEFVPTASRPGRGEATFLAIAGLVCAAVLVPVVQARVDDPAVPAVPAWLDARLDAEPTGTRVLNEWDSGAYFLWRHPQLALVMHGYGDVFTADELERNADILRLRPGWDDEVEQLEADLAVVDPDTSLGYALTSDLGWQVVEADDEFALLSPPTD